MHRIAVLVFVLGVFSVLSANVSAVPGTTDGAFEVSPTGAATYSIPIKIVPGIAGMQPQLSVQYNSQGGVGNLGVGFGLSGFSQISRCNATIATEGYAGSVNVDTTDSFCLDGQKLIPTSPTIAGYAAGSCLNGEAPTHYSTEIESFSRIVSCGAQGRGPKYFRVWTKSGLIMEYGNTEDSRVQLREDDATVIFWAQNKVSDTKTNYYEIGYFNKLYSHYLTNPEVAPEINFFPTYIAYTGNDLKSVSPSNVILLYNQPYASLPTRFVGGSRVYSGGVIQNIAIYANVSSIEDNGLGFPMLNGGTVVRQYNFEYKEGNSPITGNKLLEYVEECGFVPSVICLDKTHFTWGGPQAIDYSPQISTGQNDGIENYVRQGDFNGDGADDLIVSSGKMLLGKGDASNGGFQTQTENLPLKWVNTLINAKTIQYDQNSKQELIFQNYYCAGVNGCTSGIELSSAGNNLVVMRHGPNGYELVNTGYSVPWYEFTQIDGDVEYHNTPFSVADFDGDGLQDIVYSQETQFNNALRGTLKFAKNTNSSLVDATGTTINGVLGIKYVQDFNGDGRSDIVADIHQILFQGNLNGCYIYYSDSKPDDATFTFSGPQPAPTGYLCDSDNWKKIRILDINGDGLQDIVRIGRSTIPLLGTDKVYIHIYLNTGSGYRVTTKTFLSKLFGATGSNAVDDLDALYNNFRFSYVMDFNTDGRMDIILPNIEDGIVFGDFAEIFRSSLWSEAAKVISLADVWLVLSAVDSGTASTYGSEYIVPRLELTTTNVSHGNDKPKHIMDVNGDGRMDIVRSSGDIFQTSINTPDASGPSDMIAKITTGLGAEYNISYKPLTDDWDRANANPLLQTGTYQKVDETDVQMSMYVVSHVASDVGGADDGTLYRYSGAKINHEGRGFLGFKETEAIHYYEANGVKYQKQRIVNFYRQDFPFIGKLDKSYVYGPGSVAYPGGVLATETINNWQQRQLKVGQNVLSLFGIPALVKEFYTYFPYLNSTAQNLYWESPGGGGTAVLESTITTDYIDTDSDGVPYDRFGNVEQIVETMEGKGTAPASDPYLTSGDFTNKYTTTTTNVYNNTITADKWYLGRLSSSTVAKTGPHVSEGTKTRSSSFTYNLDTDGLLHCETVQPGDALTTQTCYTYDDYGHKAITQTTGFDSDYDDNGNALAGADKTRTTRVEYYANGTSPNGPTYQIVTTNDLNHKQTDTISVFNGQVISSEGPNGLTSYFEYDALGRPTKEIAVDGTYTETTYHHTCGSVDDRADCPPISAFITTKQQFGNDGPALGQGGTPLPKTYTYYDKLLRELLVTKTGFADTQVICKMKWYFTTGLHAGRLDFETLPYSCADSTFPGSIQYAYDVRGNVSLVTYPNGRVVITSEKDISSLGKHTATSIYRSGINGLQYIKSDAYIDVAGNLVQVMDDNRDTVRYVRNAYGTVVRTEHYNTSHVLQTAETVTATYNSLGNRVALDDPDMGVWQYRYNAFGELKWQKDAKGQIKRLTYDPLGRINTKTEPDHLGAGDVTSIWEYDIGNKAKGKLTSVCVLRTASSCDLEATNGESYTFDDFGRPHSTTVEVEGQSYTTTINSYDMFGRAEVQTYPASGLTSVSVKTKYNPNGYLESVTDAATNNPFWTANDVNIFNQVEKETFGNSIETIKTYDPDSHLIATIKTGTQSQYQDYIYTFDTVGNLEQRTDNNEKMGATRGVTESFIYDGLNRLKTFKRTGVANDLTLEYYANGNIKSRSDVGYYTYGEHGAGPHAVTTVSGMPRALGSGSVQAGDANADRLRDGHDIDMVADIVLQRTTAPALGQPDCDSTASVDAKDVQCAADNAISGGYGNDKRYVYDANGNMVRGDGKTIRYTAFNKPYEIKNQNARLEFVYDANGNRIAQRAISPAGLRVTHYVGKLFNRIADKSGGVKYENYIYAGGKLVAIKSFTDSAAVQTEELNYVHLDYQGSIDVITNEAGDNVVAKYAYDPFGKRREYVWDTYVNGEFIRDVVANLSPVGDHGYTGHEMLDNVGLIHMNGRVYDPTIGRFLSPDPFVQAPTDLQSFNRYSYVLNNPLSYTDPSGYRSFSQYFKEFGKFMHKNGQDIARAGIMVGIGYAALGPNGFMLATPGEVATGATLFAGTQATAGAIFGTGFAMGVLNGADARGAVISGLTALATAGAGNIKDYGARVVAHTVIGGVSSAMQGGDAAIGMMAAFVTAGMEPVIDSAFQENMYMQTLAAAIVGGTVAEIGGGKFANGAVTGAFVFLFNRNMHDMFEDQEENLLAIEENNRKIRTGEYFKKREYTFFSSDGNYAFDRSEWDEFVVYEQVSSTPRYGSIQAFVPAATASVSKNPIYGSVEGQVSYSYQLGGNRQHIYAITTTLVPVKMGVMTRFPDLFISGYAAKQAVKQSAHFVE